MSSGTFIIQSALKRIGAHSIAQPAAPETIIEGRNVLNSMMELWLTDDIDLGVVPLDAPGDELGEPADTTNVIIDNLALMLSPDFDNGDNIVSPRLNANATNGFIRVKDNYQQVIVPLKVVSSTLPTGMGNRNFGFPGRTFKGKGGTIGG